MKPTTSQIDAYCAALKAWSHGECVKVRTSTGWMTIEAEDVFPSISHHTEYRIAPAPPKLRDWLLSPRTLNAYPPDHVVVQSGSTDEFIHVREVSETADAEIAEKLRNHDALCMVLNKLRDDLKEQDAGEICVGARRIEILCNEMGAILK